MSRITGLAITALALYLAVNSLPDYNSRDDHNLAVAIATDNREGIARDLRTMTAPPRSFSSAKPLVTLPAPTSPDQTEPLQTAKAPLNSVVKTVATAAATRSVSTEGAYGESLQLAAQDFSTDIKPVMMKSVLVTPPKPEDVLRESQRELKRVGCYRSRVDGIWGRGSKWAFKQFVQRSDILPRAIKAQLTDQPNDVVLEYLRKTSKKVCGRPCASGQMLASNGRCVSDPVIMASITPTNAWNSSVLPAQNTSQVSDVAAIAPAVAVVPPKVVKKLRKRKSKRASRKWRRKRYSLGGPRHRAKRYKARRRYVRRYRYKRRYNRRWKRQVLGFFD